MTDVNELWQHGLVLVQGLRAHAWGPDLLAFGQVLLIDVALAGDNAIVIGMAVQGLAPRQRRLAIFWGTVAAAVLRVGFGAVTLKLLAVIGVLLAGGLLLLWVCWKMYRELRRPEAETVRPARSLGAALVQIVLADLSMSLDNVLAVAGAARGNLYVLTAGIVVGVALTGLAASVIARLLERNRWIAWAGLAVVLFVALRMVFEGAVEVRGAMP